MPCSPCRTDISKLPPRPRLFDRGGRSLRSRPNVWAAKPTFIDPPQKHFEDYGVGLPVEIATDDLDPEQMASWTEDQWDRDKASGFLKMLRESEWPDAARDREEDAARLAELEAARRRFFGLDHPNEPRASDDG